MYALADCNNFFASCERVFRPELNGKPVIVLSNNDGCAVARSNEAKAFGRGAVLLGSQGSGERPRLLSLRSSSARERLASLLSTARTFSRPGGHSYIPRQS